MSDKELELESSRKIKKLDEECKLSLSRKNKGSFVRFAVISGVYFTLAVLAVIYGEPSTVIFLAAVWLWSFLTYLLEKQLHFKDYAFEMLDGLRKLEREETEVLLDKYENVLGLK